MSNKKTIVWISDWEISNHGDTQTGYSNISSLLASELSKEYNIIALGISYRGNEHYYPLSITHVPYSHLASAIASIKNGILDEFKNVVVALDIPMQVKIADALGQIGGLNQVGIMAVEGDPIIMSVAMDMMKINKRLVISQFGAEECQKVGINATHIPIPLNLNVWRKRTEEERQSIKEILGYKDKIVFFANMDGNERKNISLHYEALQQVLKEIPNAHLVLLTRKDSPVGWRLDDLAMQYNIVNHVTTLDRGQSEIDVWKLYAMSDYFLNCSKAEGLCLPILQAMAVGVPIIATNATAMQELLDNGRGYLLDAGFVHTDVFLNTYRYYVYPEVLAQKIMDVIKLDQTEVINKARSFIEQRELSKAIQILKDNLV